MPFYTIHCDRKRGKEQISAKLAHVHADTFGGDADAVRVEFNSHRSFVGGTDVGVKRFGGLKRKVESFFGAIRLEMTDYIVVQMAFRESPLPEVWQEYCRKVAELYGDANISIYLQKLEMEVEFGNLVSLAGLESKESTKRSDPPACIDHVEEDVIEKTW
ncbi:hypothetical protein FKW77_007897 [Venturia effusa]|uniref:Uncharacterized protein n=1 Tax=Venturia effusa TaxID=50376 RepID=A0A517L9N2_9PEZI|nr:hypothetical protein FKW77_007897 [Venturia effusa]